MRKVLYELSPKSREYLDGHREYHFHCPGCNVGHSFVTQWSEARKIEFKNLKFDTPTWQFNGDIERPTFTPSLLYKWSNEHSKKNHVCHLYVTDGVIQFLNDCTHCFAGKKTPLREIDLEN